MFNSFDESGDGGISQEEFRTMFATMASDDSMFPGSFRKVLDSVDMFVSGLGTPHVLTILTC